MKLALIGAGGFRAPLMHLAVARATGRIGVDEVSAYDADASRLERIGIVARALAAVEGVPLAYKTAASLDEAIDGADFVFCAIRVGGIEGRVVDETVPLREGVLGQETTGPGGICFALRTLPVILNIAETTSRLAPSAWFLNFTNPAGLVTEALRPILGDRAIGICDGPPAMFRRIARVLGRPEAHLEFDYFGLNHLGWVKAVRHAGVDLLPDLLADHDRLSRLDEAKLLGTDRLRSLGLIPQEYLYYYYYASEAVSAVRQSGNTRGEHIRDLQSSFYRANDEAAPSELLARWRAILRDREDTYMSEAGVSKERPQGEDGVAQSVDGYTSVAISTMEAIARNETRILTLNTANRGSLQFLPDDAVVEVPCVVGGAGIRPLSVGEVPLHARGLIEIVKEVERMTIEASRTGSTALAVEALALHPLVPSRKTAQRIFEGYRSQHAILAERFAA